MARDNWSPSKCILNMTMGYGRGAMEVQWGQVPLLSLY